MGFAATETQETSAAQEMVSSSTMQHVLFKTAHRYLVYLGGFFAGVSGV